MNEGNFVARGTKIGGNLRRNFDGISYSYVCISEDKNQVQKSMVLILRFLRQYSQKNISSPARGTTFSISSASCGNLECVFGFVYVFDKSKRRLWVELSMRNFGKHLLLLLLLSVCEQKSVGNAYVF